MFVYLFLCLQFKSIMSLSQGSLEDRFSHLIQPIRDLAKNWDVNIADFLEEYLEDVRLNIKKKKGL